MLVLIWSIALLLLGIWSLACWGLGWLLALGGGDFDDLQALIERVPFAEELDRWVPGWQTLLQFLLDLSQSLLSGLASAAPWLAWAVWALGAGVLVLIAGLASAAVLLLRDRRGPPPPALTSNR